MIQDTHTVALEAFPAQVSPALLLLLPYDFIHETRVLGECVTHELPVNDASVQSPAQT